VGDAQESQLSDALNRLWAKYLSQMEERVGTLQKAAECLANGTLTPSQQELAGADAHKLAGVLGTFGLKEGTELAREAESFYGAYLDGNPAVVARLKAIAEHLQTMIANHN
jgi:HPt (histidine-containing phosphotransfer) domain-containing protein